MILTVVVQKTASRRRGRKYIRILFKHEKKYFSDIVNLQIEDSSDNKKSADQQDVFRSSCSGDDIVLRFKISHCSVNTHGSLKE